MATDQERTKMAEHGIRRRPYPYRISPVDCPDAATLKRLDPWHVQEFFRIELLLRSRSVMDLYNSEGMSPTSDIKLVLRYGFGWEVLQGEPHHCLTPKAGPIGAIAGLTVWDFDRLGHVLGLLHAVHSEVPQSEKPAFEAQLRERFLGLMVDPALPPDTVLKALRPELQRRHRPSEATAVKWRLRKFDVPTWIDYLACYDLRITQALTYGPIAELVYQEKGAKARDRAEKAVARVQRYITAAERHEWPPKTR